MQEYINANATFLYEYGNQVILLIIFVLAITSYILVKKFLITKPLKYVYLTLSSLAAFCLVGLGFMINGPMKPIVESIAKIEGSEKNIIDFEFISLKDRTQRRTAEFKGKIVVLNFFATNCPPCIKEFKALKQIEREFESSAVIVALTDEPIEIVEAFTKQHDTPELVSHFAKDKWLSLESFRPLTVFLDQDGLIQGYVIGERDYKYFKARIESLLKPKHLNLTYSN